MNSEPNKKGGSRLSRTDKPKKSQTPRTKEQKLLRILYIAAVALAAIVVVLFIAYKIIVVKPTVPDQPSRPNMPQASQVPGATEPPAVSSDRKKDFYTFLVVGKDTGGGGQTDTILLAAYDIPNQKLNVMSIPRDTLVNVSWDMKKINSVYMQYGGGDEGMDALKDEISQLVGFIPDFQVVVEWDAVGKLVDAIGGVEFDVPRNMNYDDPTQNLHIHIKKGLQTLDGEAAMGVIRYRHDNDMRYGYADGDLGRIKTQQAFLTAVVKQCLQFKNVTKIGELSEIFTTYVDTNLTVNNLAWFAQEAIFGGLNMENVNFMTMPWVSAENVYSFAYKNHPSYVAPEVDTLVTLVNESFNPFVDDLNKNELDIMYVNKDGTLASTTGVLEDKNYNKKIKGVGGSSSSGSSSGGGSTATPTPVPTPSATPDASQPPENSASPTPGNSAPPDASASPAPSQPALPEEPVVTPTPDPGPTLPVEVPVPTQGVSTPPPGIVTGNATLPTMPTPVSAG